MSIPIRQLWLSQHYSWDNCNTQKKIKSKGCGKLLFWGGGRANRVYCGTCASGVVNAL